MKLVSTLMSLLSPFVVSGHALAMPSPLHVKPGAALDVRVGTNANGGRALDEFSLLNVTDSSSPSGERIVLNYGDRFGKAWKGEPGFFQIALDKSRIVIDLSQVTRTGIDPTQLRAALAKSKYVASTDMTMDPQDQTTNLTLTLRSPVALSLSTAAVAKSQVILDLKGR